MVTKSDPDSIDLRVSHASALASTFLELASEAVVAVDESQKIVAFSGGAERIFGYSAAEVINKPLALILPAGTVDAHRDHIADFAKSGVPARHVADRGEILARRKNGEEFPAAASIARSDLAGETVFVAVLSDLSEGRHAEESLAQVRRDRELILCSAGEGIYGLDRQGLTTFVNPAAAEMLGWEPDELLGKFQHAVIHHTNADGSPYAAKNCPIYAAFNDGAVHRVDDELFWRKDGTSFPVEYVSTPICHPEDGLVGAVVTFRDISERKRAAEALEQIRRDRELILTSAGEGIYGLDGQGLTTFVNPAAAEMLGWEPDELLGKFQHAVIHHTNADGSPYAAKNCPIYAAFNDGAVHRVDDELFWRKDGTSFPVEYVSTPICHPEDGLVGAVVTFRDITERKAAEQALQNAMTELEALKDRLIEENAYLQEEIKLNHRFEEIVGASPRLRKVLHKVEQVARTSATVLILGETGTGKELFARATHDLSDRKDRPFVKVNCAALPAGIVESELFGHEKGAYTGASSKRRGRFALADGGTIFLDEIGDLPMDIQAKLLRVLQEGEFEPVGGERTMKVDVRVIAATNRDLEEAIRTGDFRTDLYYRLAVFPITVPPLRERKEDIPALVKLFVRHFAESLRKDVNTIPHSVMVALQNHTWPGNIRELQNVVERLIILTPDATLRLDDTFEEARPGPLDDGFLVSEGLEDVEREHIHSVLEKVGWRVAGEDGAAHRLKLNPSTLRSRMAKLGIKRRGPAA